MTASTEATLTITRADIGAMIRALWACKSPFRVLQNLWLEKYPFTPGGRVLDIGAKPTNSKMPTFLTGKSVDYLNSDTDEAGTISVDITDPPPKTLKKYNTVLILNVLEHVFDIDAAFRFLKAAAERNGDIVVIVPYAYPFHRAPADYWRLSKDWYPAAAQRYGLDLVTLCPLSAGALSDATGYFASTFNLYPVSDPIRRCSNALFLASVVIDRTLLSIFSLFGRRGTSYFKNPLGYACVFRLAAA
ncbi:MAG: hypothetical protein AAFR03_01315 [Pseudomonadota bacterium]